MYNISLAFILKSKTERSKKPDICLCLQSDWSWHKDNDPKVNYSGGVGEGKVGHKPKLNPC